MSKKKHLDFEINLIPAIDLLSVCICFLLLTAVWLHVGALNVKQAVGGQPASETAKKPTVWVQIDGQGGVAFDVHDSHVPSKNAKSKIVGKDGKPDLAAIQSVVEQFKQFEPGLTTALIQPQAQTVYEDIIEVMDTFRKGGLIDLGVSPL